MTADALSWQGVSVVAGGVPILHRVDLHVPIGSWLSVVGPNGAGKTTLLRTITNPAIATGSLQIAGRDNGRLKTRERARLIASVAQNPIVPPGVRVFDYVLLGRVPHQGVRCAPSIHDRERTVGVLQRLDLESFADRRVDTLSGGERQRVVLARAIVQETPILVLDEPTAALDVGHQLEVLELVADLRLEHELTVLSTVHDLTVAGQFADRIAVLADGRLAAEGPPAEVLTSELVGRHWGVDATCEVAEDGSVVVTVRRRRERTHADLPKEQP